MILHIILLFVGVALVLWGADRFTDGASALARILGVSEWVIGLTIVAFGTSAPELCVSIISAVQGTGGVALGNVIGSNIFNTLLIMGVSAALCSRAISADTSSLKRDMPFMVVLSLLLFLLQLDGNVSRIDGIIFMLLLALCCYFTIKNARRRPSLSSSESTSAPPPSKPFIGILWIVIGLACLIVGSQMFVSGAVYLAGILGVSETLVGITIVAGGTSLPELATSAVAAVKGRSDMAIGNIVGSNILNILLVLGVTATIHPLSTVETTLIDYIVFVGSALLMWIFCRSRSSLNRLEGWVLIVCFIIYMIYRCL